MNVFVNNSMKFSKRIHEKQSKLTKMLHPLKKPPILLPKAVKKKAPNQETNKESANQQITPFTQERRTIGETPIQLPLLQFEAPNSRKNPNLPENPKNPKWETQH